MKNRVEILKISQDLDVSKCPNCGSLLVPEQNNWRNTTLGGLPFEDADYAEVHYEYLFCSNCPKEKNEFVLVDGRNLHFWFLDTENPKYEGQKERWDLAGTWTLVGP